MRFAYADPPYFGLAEKFYGKMHPEAAEYDKIETHAKLVDRLCSEFDGWAMSLHTPTLKNILPLCPDDVRVCAWVKPWCSFKPNVNPAYAWEPVIVRGCKKRQRKAVKVRDYISANIVMGKWRTAKPEVFCFWVFAMLGIEDGDEFVDLFPGSGAVTRAYEKWAEQPSLLMGETLKEVQFPKALFGDVA